MPLLVSRFAFFPYIIITVRRHRLSIDGEWGSMGVSEGEEGGDVRGVPCRHDEKREKYLCVFHFFEMYSNRGFFLHNDMYIQIIINNRIKNFSNLIFK